LGESEIQLPHLLIQALSFFRRLACKVDHHLEEFTAGSLLRQSSGGRYGQL
jgi:hypothetical protein